MSYSQNIEAPFQEQKNEIEQLLKILFHLKLIGPLQSEFNQLLADGKQILSQIKEYDQKNLETHSLNPEVKNYLENNLKCYEEYNQFFKKYAHRHQTNHLTFLTDFGYLLFTTLTYLDLRRKILLFIQKQQRPLLKKSA